MGFGWAGVTAWAGAGAAAKTVAASIAVGGAVAGSAVRAGARVTNTVDAGALATKQATRRALSDTAGALKLKATEWSGRMAVKAAEVLRAVGAHGAGGDQKPGRLWRPTESGWRGEVGRRHRELGWQLGWPGGDDPPGRG